MVKTPFIISSSNFEKIFSALETSFNEGFFVFVLYSSAFYAMKNYLKKNKIPKNANVLFWHTGGFPANFYYANQLK